jgi:hypothetical protein
MTVSWKSNSGHETTNAPARWPGRFRRSCGVSEVVRERGLEPPPPFGDTALNRARLPVPPLARGREQDAREAGSVAVGVGSRQRANRWRGAPDGMSPTTASTPENPASGRAEGSIPCTPRRQRCVTGRRCSGTPRAALERPRHPDATLVARADDTYEKGDLEFVTESAPPERRVGLGSITLADGAGCSRTVSGSHPHAAPSTPRDAHGHRRSLSETHDASSQARARSSRPSGDQRRSRTVGAMAVVWRYQSSGTTGASARMRRSASA